MKGTGVIVLIAISMLAGSTGEARWIWDSSNQDETAILEDSSEQLVDAHEQFKTLGSIETRPFDRKELTEAVRQLNTRLNNDLMVGNEVHYAAVLARVREQLDDRVVRYANRIKTLLDSDRPSDHDRLKRLIDHDYFSLPLMLELDQHAVYESMEQEVRQAVNR